MLIRQIEVDTFYLFLIGAFIGITIALSMNQLPHNRVSFSIPVIQNNNILDSFNLIPKEIASQTSPDGTKKVTMTVTSAKITSKTYTFTVSNSDDSNQQTLYQTALPANESMDIPFNTWSPDNTYLFLQHTANNYTEAFVFRADRKPITDTKQYLNVTDIFTRRGTGYNYQEMTGWASDTLLIVNTIQTDGSKGPSFWVEIPSKAVIPLATQF